MTDYTGLSTQLRKCAKAFSCAYCEKRREQGCIWKMMIGAADAIDELSAKATPKRVGFSGWKGTRDTRYKCPFCEKYVRNDESYCHKCGQALMFPMISHTPYVPGQRQEVIVTWPDDLPKEAE